MSDVALGSPGRPVPSWRAAAALATAAAGGLTLASSLQPAVPWRQRVLESIEPDRAQAVAHVAGIAGGIALIGLAWSISRGRRSGGHAAVVLLGVLALVHLAKGLDYEEALMALGLAGLLRLGLRAVARGGGPPAMAGAAGLALGALGAAYATAFVALEVSGRRLDAGTALVRAAGALGTGAAGLPGVDVRTAVHVLAALAAVGTAALLRSLFAPWPFSEGHDEAEHARAAHLVAAHAVDSIAPFVLRADKAFFFSHGGVLAYRTLRDTAVVSGDPVGPPGTAAAILGAFLQWAGRRGWEVVVMGAREEHLPAYRTLGLRTMRIGAEAIVDPRTFTLGGRSRRVARKAVHRVARHGWTIETLDAGSLDAEHVAGIRAVERAWRAGRPRLYGCAMTMDRLWGAQEDAGDVYVVARRPDGRIRAFQRYVRYRGGLSLDAMRRLDDEPNGISDALVVAALERARELGCHEVSLNFSAFAHLTTAATLERRRERVAAWLLRRLHHRFQLERLVRFAGKFGPEWRPRHLAYVRTTRLPRSALRVMQAEAYVRPPRPRTRPNAWRPRPLPADRSVAGGAAG